MILRQTKSNYAVTINFVRFESFIVLILLYIIENNISSVSFEVINMDKHDLKNEKYKISVIVPCYNTEKYLQKCVDSILDQSYTNIELILVDDGSKDNTADICDSYALKDRRVRVIHKVNGGASSARNAGLQAATGDYIAFADSDDWMVRHTYRYLMYLLAKYNADCTIGRTDAAFEKDGVFYYKKTTKVPDKVSDSTEVTQSLFIYGCGVVNKLIKREFFNGITFAEGVINEDELIMLRLYLKMNKIAVAGRQTYFYRAHENSVTRSRFSIRNLDFYYNTMKNVEIIKQERPQLLEYALARHYKAAVFCAAKLHFHLIGSEGRKHRKVIKKELKENRKSFLSNKILPRSYKLIGLICSFV